jgi:hypothetical protein
MYLEEAPNLAKRYLPARERVFEESKQATQDDLLVVTPFDRLLLGADSNVAVRMDQEV